MKHFIATVSIAILAIGCHQTGVKQLATDHTESDIETVSHIENDNVTQPVSKENEPQKKKTKRSLEDMLLFHPAKHPTGNWKPRGFNYEDVWITSKDGTKIHGWYCPAKQPRATVLYAHGNAGHLAHRAERIKRLVDEYELTVLIFDYRGYGRSEGVPTVEGAIQDGKAARTYLAKKEGIKESDIVIMGRSLGGAIAVQLAADESPRGLILESTFSSLREIGGYHFPLLAWIVPKSKLNSVVKITDVHAPLLMSHGDRDRTIPLKFGKKIYSTANEPKTWFEDDGGTHNSPQSNEYYREFDRFIDKLK